MDNIAGGERTTPGEIFLSGPFSGCLRFVFHTIKCQSEIERTPAIDLWKSYANRNYCVQWYSVSVALVICLSAATMCFRFNSHKPTHKIVVILGRAIYNYFAQWFCDCVFGLHFYIASQCLSLYSSSCLLLVNCIGQPGGGGDSTEFKCAFLNYYSKNVYDD